MLDYVATLTRKPADVHRGDVEHLRELGFDDIAILQISELAPVPGLDIVGPLPDEVQKITIFSAGLGARSPHREMAVAFVAFLKSKQAEPTLRANGLEPA